MELDRPHRRQRSRRVAIATVAVAAMALPASAAVVNSGKRPPAQASDQGSPTPPSSAPVVTAPPVAAPLVNIAADMTTADPKAAGLPAAGKPLTGDAAIPATVLAAYRKAAATLAVEQTSCHVTWPLLAGIGKVETDHGRTWGAKARLTSTGDVVPTILGPVLDGRNGTGKLLDTDGGVLDHDRHYDRAVGPMQFVPATWREFGRDGNGDGKKNPNNVWDASLAAAGYLCSGGRNLADTADLRAAILSYNPSSSYVRSVLAWAAAYQRASVGGPSLGSVPNPLVLGAGGQAGDNPYGDGFSTGDSGVAADPGSLSALFGPPGGSAPVGGGAIVVQRAPTQTAVAAKPTKPVVKPKPAVKPAPACVDPAIAAPAKAAITANPVDMNHDGKNDALRVMTTITVAKAGKYVFGLLLRDASDYGVATTAHSFALRAGKQTFTEDLSGQAIGDAGANGPATLRLAVRLANAPTTCAVVLVAKGSAGTIDASTYDGWTVDVKRLQQRLAADVAAKLITGVAAKTLTAQLKSSPPDYRAFLVELKKAKTIAPVEQTRLASLAQRLIDQAAVTPDASPSPSESATPTPSPSLTPSPSVTPSPSPTPRVSVSPSLTPTP